MWHSKDSFMKQPQKKSVFSSELSKCQHCLILIWHKENISVKFSFDIFCLIISLHLPFPNHCLFLIPPKIKTFSPSWLWFHTDSKDTELSALNRVTFSFSIWFHGKGSPRTIWYFTWKLYKQEVTSENAVKNKRKMPSVDGLL